MMAGATVFTDNEEIDAQNQVNMITALGIVNGYPDGSFGPDKTITRAEAAKMIYVLKNGKDVGSDNYKNAANPFSDVYSGHWARGYINYCYLNGIIAGVGNGKFDPEGSVTGAQLAKMILTVIGYDANRAGLVGTQWMISTMSLAFENNLFDDYTVDVSAAAPRQDAAILFYNAVYTPTVVYRDGEYTNLNSDGDAYLATAGKKYFGLEEEEGVLTAANDFDMTDGNVDEDTITINNHDYDFEGGREFVGQDVKVVYKVAANGDKTVYDIVPTGDSKVYGLTLGDIDHGTNANQVKFNNKNYTLDNSFKLYKNYGDALANGGDLNAFITANLDLKSGNPVSLIDADGNGTVDYGFITERTFSYVGSMDSKSISFGEGGKKFLNDDGDTVVFAEGIEEGDYVFYYKDLADDNYYLAKADSVSGAIEGHSSSAETTVYISDVSGSKELAVNTATNDLDEASQAAPEIGDTYTLFLDGKYWIAALSEEDGVAGSGNYAYVKSADNETGSGAGKTAAKVEVMIPGEDDPIVYELNKDSKYVDANGDLVKVTLGDITNQVAGKLFAYSIKSDGTILLTQDLTNYTTGAKIKYDSDSDIFTVSGAGAANGSYLLADDAVVFYNTTGNTWKIYGAGDFDENFNANASLCAFSYKSVGGFNYIKAAIIDDDQDLAEQSGAASDTYFGFLTGNPMVGHDSSADEDYVRYTVWVNGELKTYTDKDTNSAVAGKQAFVAFTLKADGSIKDIWNANTASDDANAGNVGDIQAYNKTTSKITISGRIYNITEDTVTLYVDYDETTGETGSGYPKISSSDAATNSNCYYVTDKDHPSDLLFIVVDSSATLPETLA